MSDVGMTSTELVQRMSSTSLNEPGDVTIHINPCIAVVITVKENLQDKGFTYDIKIKYLFNTLRLDAYTVVASGISDKSKILALIHEVTMYNDLSNIGKVYN